MVASREPHVTLHVYSEGECTEIGWLAFLQGAARGLNITIEPTGGVGVPATVVAAALEKRKELNRLSRGQEVYRRDEVWVVFDRDDHDLTSAMLVASNAGIGLVFSNACFELWPLLHREDVGAYQERDWLQRRLHTVHPQYDHDRRAQVDWGSIGSHIVAVERAIQLHFRSPDATTWTAAMGDRARPEGALSNPMTSAWLFHRRCVECPQSPDRLLGLGRWEAHPRVEEVRPVLLAMVAEPTRQAVACVLDAAR